MKIQIDFCTETSAFEIGDERYIKAQIIEGDRTQVWYSTSPWKTNRGQELVGAGWLGSYTDAAGTQFDYHTYGKCKLVAVDGQTETWEIVA